MANTATAPTTATSNAGSKLGQYIRLADACRFFPGEQGKSISVQTVYRWALYGTRGVKLRAVQIGNCLCTTEVWCEAVY